LDQFEAIESALERMSRIEHLKLRNWGYSENVRRAWQTTNAPINPAIFVEYKNILKDWKTPFEDKYPTAYARETDEGKFVSGFFPGKIDLRFAVEIGHHHHESPICLYPFEDDVAVLFYSSEYFWIKAADNLEEMISQLEWLSFELD